MIDQKLRVAESQKVFHSGSNLLPEKGPNYYPEHLKPKEKMLRIMIWHYLGDLNQSEQLSKIKPPFNDAQPQTQVSNIIFCTHSKAREFAKLCQ